MRQHKRTWTRKVREVRIEGDLAFIPMPDGREAIIDAADIRLVNEHNWSASDGCVLQNIVLNICGLVDHKNGNWLDNRRDNLRPASKAQNAHNRGIASNNSTGFKGVSFRRDRGTYLASIRIEGQLRKLGTFSTPEEAALAYDDAARSEFGEFAALNFARAGERSAITDKFASAA